MKEPSVITMDLLRALSGAGFSFTLDHVSLAGLPQPSWIHSDEIDVSIDQYPDRIDLTVRFEHQHTLLKYGADSEILLGMKRHCANEWFTELEQRFQKVAEYYNLRWDKFEELEDDVVPAIIYALIGRFQIAQGDRILACLLEIRSVLSSDT